MSDISYSEKLRNLSKDYYQNHIKFEEYRSQRKFIIDKVDEEFNGYKIQDIEDTNLNNIGPETSGDKSVFMKTIAFFKNNDVED